MTVGQTTRPVAMDFLRSAEDEIREVVDFAESGTAPVASVIIPTFNRRSLVLDTLEAIAAQEQTEFEVIVADDCSTDGSVPAIIDAARRLGLAGRLVSLRRNRGPATARNCALHVARADTIAFTDSDCIPAPEWLAKGLSAFRSGVGIVQGRVLPPVGATIPFFSHFIHMESLDGSFATCNAFYRREALEQAGGFDPSCLDWEDRDMGCRVLSLGWEAVYEPKALVYHQVLPQSPAEWMRWPGQLVNLPKWVKRHPGARKYLFGRYWVNPAHAALTAAVIGAMLAPKYRPALLLTLPYLASIPVRHGLGGRWPLAKAALHVWWDALGVASAAAGSLRNRKLVL